MKLLVSVRRRTPNARLVKRDSTYTVEETAALLTVHVNTVRNWQSDGLHPIDTHRPILFHGSDLQSFLRRRQTRRRQHCAPGELYCFKCRQPRQPKDRAVKVEMQNERVLRMIGTCEVCGTRMFRAGSVLNLKSYKENFVLQPAKAEHIAVCDDPAVNCEVEKEEKR